MKLIKNFTALASIVPNAWERGKKARTIVLTSVAVGGLVTAGLVYTVHATPSFNIVSSAVLARASFLDPVDIKFKIDAGSQEVIHVSGAQDTVMQQIIFGPGGHSGWHSHPGPAVAIVKAGALALYDSEDPTCTPRIYFAGEAFVDHGQGHAHFAHNPSATENTEVWVTYFDVPPGTSPRLDEANPGNCGF